MSKIFTLWAAHETDFDPWLIAAEGDISWESDPERCEKVFADAKKALGQEEGFEFREVTIDVDLDVIRAAFWPLTIAGTVEPKPATA